MRAYVEFLREELQSEGSPNEVENLLQKIEHQTMAMEALIQDLLTYSRVHSVDLAYGEVPLQEAVTKVLGTMRNLPRGKSRSYNRR